MMRLERRLIVAIIASSFLLAAAVLWIVYHFAQPA